MSSMLRSIKRNAERASLSGTAMQNYRIVGKMAKHKGTTRAKEVQRLSKERVNVNKKDN